MYRLVESHVISSLKICYPNIAPISPLAASGVIKDKSNVLPLCRVFENVIALSPQILRFHKRSPTNAVYEAISPLTVKD